MANTSPGEYSEVKPHLIVLIQGRVSMVNQSIVTQAEHVGEFSGFYPGSWLSFACVGATLLTEMGTINL